LIEQGLEAEGPLANEPGDVKDMTVRRFRKFAPESGKAAPPAAIRATQLPDWLASPVKPEVARADVLRPSGAIDDERRAFGGQGVERRRALARGTHAHRLMQSLPDVPPARRAEAARRYLARQKLDDAERSEIAKHTLRLLGDLRFDKLFLPGSRAEVSIVGRYKGRNVSGQIDRLVVTADEVQIVDYKTNRPAPKSVAEAIKRHPGYVRQLALYRAVLAQLYPGRPVLAALLWTDTPDLMEIPAADLDAALAILTST
jgi:ATP-dependent helicase/nuclease subunit A